jgi:xanthine dehydrogenase iron-sulfur cluster and FAD-binding subunit A
LVSIKANPAVVLLDFIRKYKHLKGTKEGCKEGDCGACSVLSGYLAAGYSGSQKKDQRYLAKFVNLSIPEEK